MPNYNPSDISWALIKEVTPNTTPASPAFLKIDHIEGDLQYNADFIESQVVKANRASAGGRKVGFKDEGSLKVHLHRDAAIDALLESALSGTFTSNTLKAGSTDTSLTIEKKLLASDASALYRRYTGCQVSKFALSCEASGNAEVTFDILGMAASTGTAILTSATYANASTTTKLTGLDIGTFTIAGLSSPEVRKVELSVEQNREAHDKFGSASARAIGTSGNHKVRLSVEFYRADWSPETLFANSDTAVAVSFSIGTLTNGYTFTLPAAVPMMPQMASDGSKELVKLEFAGSYDGTALTDISVTRP